MMELPENRSFQIDASLEEYERMMALDDRRLYLTSTIKNSDEESEGMYMSKCVQIVSDIISFNRFDAMNNVKKRKPIRLYINSPGGDVGEGFPIVSVIELSKTPVYTINIGQWSSMAFLIGISGHKRFSLPRTTFLMHEGTNFVYGATNKAQDKMKFDERFENEVVKSHVLAHSRMTPTEYDALVRVEYYMLPEDAIEHGFIDEIVTDIDAII